MKNFNVMILMKEQNSLFFWKDFLIRGGKKITDSYEFDSK